MSYPYYTPVFRLKQWIFRLYGGFFSKICYFIHHIRRAALWLGWGWNGSFAKAGLVTGFAACRWDGWFDFMLCNSSPAAAFSGDRRDLICAATCHPGTFPRTPQAAILPHSRPGDCCRRHGTIRSQTFYRDASPSADVIHLMRFVVLCGMPVCAWVFIS